MDATKIARATLKFLVKSGTSAATANLITANRNHSDNNVIDTYYQTTSFASGLAAGWMLGDMVAEFAEAKFDETVAQIKNATTD